MRRAIYTVTVDGNTIDSTLDPILISLSIKSDDKGTCDELSIEVDDSGGQVELPRKGAAVEAEIGWDDTGQVSSFTGFMDDSHSGGKDGKASKGSKTSSSAKHGKGGEGAGGPVHAPGSRSKGRALTMTAKSADMTSKVKGHRSAHKDNASFGDVAQEWGQAAGLSNVKVDSSLAAIQRPYWSMANESYMAWGDRIRRELGATFKIFGTTGVFVPRTGGTSASGKPLTPIAVTWGDNLIDWSASPVLSRPQYGSCGTRWYDPKAAKHRIETSDGGSGTSSAKHAHPLKHANQANAQGQSNSNKTELDREKGGCDGVTIDGNPDAQPGAPCTITGIRDGVDGTYVIESVTHTLSRHSGFPTRLTLKQPTGGAGTDSRAATTKTATS